MRRGKIFCQQIRQTGLDRQTEINKFYPSLEQNDIFRFKVKMNDAAPMQIGQCVGNLQDNGAGLGKLKFSVPAHGFTQITARHIFLDNILARSVAVEKSDNMGMIEQTTDSFFILVMIKENWGIDNITKRNFQGHHLIGEQVPGPVNSGHGALIQGIFYQKTIKSITGLQWFHISIHKVSDIAGREAGPDYQQSLF